MRRLARFALFLSACGSSGEAADPGALLPLTVGAQWDYRVIGEGGVSARSERVIGEDVVEGRRVAVVEATQDGTVTRSYLAATDPLVLVLRRVVDGPGSLSSEVELRPGEPRAPRSTVLDAGTRFEASWTAVPPGDTATETWIVEATDDDVEVDAGRFRAVRVRRTRPDGSVSLLWFAPGVGLVRCEGDVREILIGYSVP